MQDDNGGIDTLSLSMLSSTCREMASHMEQLHCHVEMAYYLCTDTKFQLDEPIRQQADETGCFSFKTHKVHRHDEHGFPES